MRRFEDENIKAFLDGIGTPIDRSKFFITDDFEAAFLSDPKAVFKPKDLKGFIKDLEDEKEIYNKYIHEAGHGAYFENIESGEEFRNLEKRLYSLENRIFGEELGGKVFSIPGDVEISREIDFEDLDFLDIENRFEKYYIVEPSILEDYRLIRKNLKRRYKSSLAEIEGFSLLLEEELGESPRIDEYPESYLEGYRELKGVYDSGGWRAVKDRL